MDIGLSTQKEKVAGKSQATFSMILDYHHQRRRKPQNGKPQNPKPGKNGKPQRPHHIEQTSFKRISKMIEN